MPEVSFPVLLPLKFTEIPSLGTDGSKPVNWPNGLS